MKKIVYIILILFFMSFVRIDNLEALNLNNNSYKMEVKVPKFTEKKYTCEELLGNNLTKVVRAGVKIIQVAGAIIAIVNGMIKLIPAVLAKDADGLQKASKSLVAMAVILALIFILPSLVSMIGHLFKYDVSCFF